MIRTVLAFVLSVPVVALPAHADEPPRVQKLPRVLPGQPGVPIVKKPVIRVFTNLRFNNGYMEIGEEKDLYATLTRADGTPVAGKTVTFDLYDQNGKLAIPLGSAVTAETGRATLVRARIVERPGLALEVGQYTMRTQFKGDGDLASARGEGSFLLQKGSTQCRVGPSRDGGATATLTFAKRSFSGIDALPESEAPTFVINGATTPRSRWQYSAGRWDDRVGLQGNGPWTIQMTYKGGALYHPCVHERSLTSSSETTYQGPH